jgi:hypothetical protein
MKHFFADALILNTVFCLFINIPITLSHAQSMQERLVCIDYVNSNGENGSTIFDWDSGGTPELSLWALNNGSRYSLNTLSYDRRGNLTEKKREYSDHKDTRQQYWYDERNRLVREDFYLLDTLKGTTTFEYDKVGKPSRVNCCAYLGWIHGVMEFSCDAEGRRTGGTLVRNNQQQAKIFYVYNSNGSLQREQWRFSGGWEQEFRYEYGSIPQSISFANPAPFLNTTSSRVEREEYQYGQSPCSPSFYSYRRDGRLTEKVFRRWDSVSTVTRYLYDREGIPFAGFRRFSDGKNAYIRYGYDNRRLMTSRILLRNDGVRTEESFLYDADGRLQKAILQNADFWLTGTLSVTMWRRGMPLAASFAAAKGPSATIVYRYDSANNLSEIEWTFTNGKRQRYWFEYRSKK